MAHVSFADPTCLDLNEILYQAGQEVGATVYKGGTYLCLEGPQFPTRAESRIYRQWGVDVIGMTNLTEAKLAREAEICYAALVPISDYDAWHETEEDVSVESVVVVLVENVRTSKRILRRAILSLPEKRSCPCAHALKDATITSPEAMPQKTRRDPELLASKSH